MMDFGVWTKVVTHPLGLSSFVMFLVFLVLSKVVKGRNRTITLTVFLGLAVVTLVGGLLIAWTQVKASWKAEQPQNALGVVEIKGNSGVVETGPINTNVNVNTVQSPGFHVGSVEVQNNQGNVKTGQIETHVTVK